MYLSHNYWKNLGFDYDLEFRSGMPSIFGVPVYAKKLNEICDQIGVQRHFQN